jgi:group I intron endonuclease
MYTLYKITCSANGKVYIGYTSKTADERFQTHLLNAKWKRKTALYDAIRKYGSDAFSVETVLTCDDHSSACKHEIQLIVALGCLLPAGYNMTQGGDGVPLTAEHWRRIGERKRGVCSPKQLAANRRRVGQKVSEETRAKLSAVRKGRKQTPEQVAKRAAAFRKTIDAQISAGERAPLRERKLASGCVAKLPRSKRPRVWTDEDRARERARAFAQWTPEARQAAKERAIKQWTPEARKKVSERKVALSAKRKAERSAA